MLTALTSIGTKPWAKVDAPATNAILMISPRVDWNKIRVCVICKRSRKVREALSPMTNHDARGRPSFRTSATTPIYVYASVVTTKLESMFATQSLESVL